MKTSAEHMAKLKALGLTDLQIAEGEKKGLDWAAILAALPQIIALIMSFINPPTP